MLTLSGVGNCPCISSYNFTNARRCVFERCLEHFGVVLSVAVAVLAMAAEAVGEAVGWARTIVR